MNLETALAETQDPGLFAVLDNGYEAEPVEELEKLCADRGLVFVRPLPNELFIDLDSRDALRRFEMRCVSICSLIEHSYRMHKSKTEGHWHAVVRLTRAVTDEPERLFLEACFGSDCRRAIKGYGYIVLGQRDWGSVLFMTKESAAALEAWRNKS